MTSNTNYSKKYFEKCYKKGKDFWSKSQLTKLFRKFISLVKKDGGREILDLGCGVGRISLDLGREGFKTFGIDYSPLAIKKSKELLKKEKISSVILVRGNILNYKFPRNQFDAAIDIGTLHHIPQKYWNKYIRQLKKALKPKGLVYLRVFSINSKDHFGFTPTKKKNWYIHQRHYDHFFSEREIKELFRDFEIIDFHDLQEGAVKGAPVVHSYVNCILKLRH